MTGNCNYRLITILSTFPNLWNIFIPKSCYSYMPSGQVVDGPGSPSWIVYLFFTIRGLVFMLNTLHSRGDSLLTKTTLTGLMSSRHYLLTQELFHRHLGEPLVSLDIRFYARVIDDNHSTILRRPYVLIPRLTLPSGMQFPHIGVSFARFIVLFLSSFRLYYVTHNDLWNKLFTVHLMTYFNVLYQSLYSVTGLRRVTFMQQCSLTRNIYHKTRESVAVSSFYFAITDFLPHISNYASD